MARARRNGGAALFQIRLFQIGLQTEAGTLLPLCPRHTRRRQRRQTIGKRELSQQKSLNLLVVKVCSCSCSSSECPCRTEKISGRRPRLRLHMREVAVQVEEGRRPRAGDATRAWSFSGRRSPPAARRVPPPVQIAKCDQWDRALLPFLTAQHSRGGGRLTDCTVFCKGRHLIVLLLPSPHLSWRLPTDRLYDT